MNLIATILSYIETPQYLRKRLFKIKPELRYAGILPPLRTPHHPLSDKINVLKIGEFREGAVVSLVKEGSLVDIGVEHLMLVPSMKLQLGSRVTVKITELGKNPKATIANRNEISNYWGYKTVISSILFGRLVKTRNFDLKIATSKLGEPFTNIKDKLTEQWRKSTSVLVAFGAPAQGLPEIAAKENLELNEIVHFIVNTIPNQGTETVRTEEAVCASLAILNLLDS